MIMSVCTISRERPVGPWPTATTIGDWLPLIRAEYREIPGLCLSRWQVQRLWGLDADTCDTLLASLVDARFLRQTRGGAFIRADVGTGHDR
jgi:hypothetical protein